VRVFVTKYRRPVWAEIDLAAIASNVEALCDLLEPRTQLMAVVKADGYGHGGTHVAKAAVASGAHRLGVALAEEALELRAAGIDVPIHIFGETPAQAAHEIVEYDLIPSVVTPGLPEALSEAATRRHRTVKVHVKVDTGMHRVGLSPDDVVDFVRWCASLPSVDVEGVYTHFATADEPDSPAARRQLGLFDQVLLDLDGEDLLPPMKHAANSAATILMPQSHYDMVRCGIAVYGLHPGPATKGEIDLRPALSLKCRVSFVQKLAADEGVSYGHTFKTERETTIATLPLGYADGYPRRLSNEADVLVGGHRMRVAGTICMDQFMIDAGPDGDIQVDDEAVLIGRSGAERITADDLAAILGTINYEVVCMISKRVPRIHV